MNLRNLSSSRNFEMTHRACSINISPDGEIVKLEEYIVWRQESQKLFVPLKIKIKIENDFQREPVPFSVPITLGRIQFANKQSPHPSELSRIARINQITRANVNRFTDILDY